MSETKTNYNAAKRAVEVIQNSELDAAAQEALTRDAVAYASGIVKGYQMATALKGGGVDGKTA